MESKTEITEKLKNYLLGRVKTTGWNFIPIHEITSYFGSDASVRDCLNDLRKQGIVRKRTGGNYDLIEIIIDR